MPDVFMELALAAAREAGFVGFIPDACLINRYIPGAKMSLHQDKDEHGYEWPVVSVSLGLPAMFLFGGHQRSDSSQRVPLLHGDVVVWGGVDRLRFHGVMPVRQGEHSLLGEQRINFTFRKARADEEQIKSRSRADQEQIKGFPAEAGPTGCMRCTIVHTPSVRTHPLDDRARALRGYASRDAPRPLSASPVSLTARGVFV
nr:hypothetical protein [Tanacetum cinerariifolium]